MMQWNAILLRVFLLYALTSLLHKLLSSVCLLNDNKINLEFFVHSRHLYCCKDIALRRSTSGSLGFSIVGGQEELNCNQSFFIRSIVEGTPAYNDGRIRYGQHTVYFQQKACFMYNHNSQNVPFQQKLWIHIWFVKATLHFFGNRLILQLP